MTTFSVQHKIEVQFVPGGTFVDISTRSRGLQIERPRATVDTKVEATTVSIVLDNTPATAAEVTAWGGPTSAVGYVPFMPDNPAGAFSPNVERDRMVRVTYTWNAGANTSVRFFGWVDKWAPDLSGDVAQSTVTLTGSDVMSRYERRDLISDYGEQITALTNADYWPYDDTANSTYLRGLSLDRLNIPPGQVIPSKDGTGSLSLGKPDGQILVDGAITLARGDGSITNSPVVLHQLRVGSGVTVSRVSMWVRLEGDFTGTADDICAAYDFYGALIWRLQAAVVGGVVQWRVLDENQFARTFYTTSYPRDDSWHWLSVLFFDDAGTPATNLAIRDQTIPDRVVAGYVPGWPRDPSKNNVYLVVGGNMNPRAAGKQANTVNGSISGIWVQYQALGASQSYLSAAGVPFTALSRSNDIIGYGASVDAPVGGGLGGSATDLTPVQLTGKPENVLEAWREHTRTTQGQIFTRPDGRRQINVPSAVNPTAVSLSLDVEADLHMPAGGWAGERAERPTRQTVNSPVGTVNLIDATTEAATGLRLTGSELDSSGGDLAVARGLAFRQMTGGRSRLTSFGFDVTLMPTDRRTAVMALLPYQRIRLTNLPVAYLGLTYMDVYASGWTETYDVVDQACLFEFDTDPADDPAEGVFDDDEYGRFALGDGVATVTGGTCVGTTGTGTVIITTTSVMSTAAGDYPADLDWNGERITVTAPGGATSPQTFPVTVRGVAPTVARVHAAGETLEVWNAMRFGA